MSEEMVAISSIDVSVIQREGLSPGQVMLEARVNEEDTSINLTIALSEGSLSYLRMMADIAFEPALNAIRSAIEDKEEEENEDA